LSFIFGLVLPELGIYFNSFLKYLRFSPLVILKLGVYSNASERAAVETLSVFPAFSLIFGKLGVTARPSALLFSLSYDFSWTLPLF
jgi:hypothetical protein